MPLSAFVIVGAISLSIALLEAWILVAQFSSAAMQRLVPGRADLVRSHIDYLLMTLFLFAFYGLARTTGAAIPAWAIAAACLGALFNPFGFLVYAVRPDFREAPPKAFFAMITTSCVATTVGYAVTAWTIAFAAM